MNRMISFAILFATTLLLQIYLFNNLSISIYFSPLIYTALLLLLPVDTLHAGLLAAGLATGLLMDAAMGTGGLNTLAIMPLAFLRPWIIGLFYNREEEHDASIPSTERFGPYKFLRYLICCVLLHHLLFFSFEALSWGYVWHTLLRIAISGAASVGFLWLIARLFTFKLPVHLP